MGIIQLESSFNLVYIMQGYEAFNPDETEQVFSEYYNVYQHHMSLRQSPLRH